MTDISQFYFVSPYPFEASSHAGFPFSVNHLPCFCDNYIIFAPFCQQESTGFRVKYPIRFLCNFTTRILCTIFSLSSWYNFCKYFPCEKRFPQFYPLFHMHPCGKRWKRAGFVWCFLRAIPHKDCATDAKQDIFMITYNIKDVKAIPHKDCATDASSNFSSDETKSGVNT